MFYIAAEALNTQVRKRERPPKWPRDAVAPPAVGALFIEHSRAPSFRGDAGLLGGNEIHGRIGEIAHHMPPDRRIGIEEPVDDAIARACRRRGEVGSG
jgi:hypothetical protein